MGGITGTHGPGHANERVPIVTGIGVIVRECEERTADACYTLLTNLFGSTRVHRVSDRPFIKTLRRSLELGVSLNYPWTLCIDADVLALPDLKTFVAEAQTLPCNTFAIQALVADKLLPSRRPAGNHLYRTKLIPKALTLIQDEESLRPETDLIQAMQRRGYGFHQTRRVIGLHDFEQNIKDVFAKAYLHAHKHRHLQEDFIPIWRGLADVDPDYATAIAAWEMAALDQDSPRPCRDYMNARFATSDMTRQEKGPLVEFSMDDAVKLFDKSMSTSETFEGHCRHLQEAIDSFVFPARPRENMLVRKGLGLYRYLARRLITPGNRSG